MTEMEPPEAGIDSLLWHSMAGPIPNLPPDFDQHLLRRLGRRSQGLDRYPRILLACYGLVSVVTSAAIMRGQGLDWGLVAVTTLGPVALVAIVSWTRRAMDTTTRT